MLISLVSGLTLVWLIPMPCSPLSMKVHDGLIGRPMTTSAFTTVAGRLR
jgi:hypothetical protein